MRVNTAALMHATEWEREREIEAIAVGEKRTFAHEDHDDRKETKS